MYRRGFIKSLSLLSLAPAFAKADNNHLTNIPVEKIKPKRLKEGDTIGLIAPGSYISQQELDESITKIKSLGFKVVYLEGILNRSGYLAGDDKRRADELHTMFSRKDVNGIICARGGYGCTRILPLLNYNLIKDNPKVIIGFSDVTALLYGLYTKTGLISFHGPVGISTFNEFSLYYFKKVLMSPEDRLVLNNTGVLPADEAAEKPVTIRSGKAHGELAGGNLSVAVSLIGTPYDINTEGKILFFEETGEEPYRIDRMFTQMMEAGKFEKAAGIMLGIFDKCESKEAGLSAKFSFSLLEVLYDRLFDLGIPVIYGLSFGHIRNKFTIPVGINAELDVDNFSLTILENAVI